MHHGAGLRLLLEKDGRRADATAALVGALGSGQYADVLAAPDVAMLDYARKLTSAPASITRADIDGLRSAGFDDRAIHDICAVTAYFAFVNRIADGLGVELEPDRR